MEYDIIVMDGEYNVVAMYHDTVVQVVMVTNNERKANKMLRKLASRQRTVAKRKSRRYKMERYAEVI
jgi:hypothetical protein